ncbi:MAG: saccharopine dehydrogenase NADP-binding domain-containing protein [Bacteroidota bacterium]|jgi:short subunit dehydrogenase-like uncharacterized protein|nr:saccharopine dehydrogenase NADP-binding domain-containing protein [Bacteroidota bacterium]
MKDKFLLYGAYGYTGKLIIEESLSKNLKPIIAGRKENLLAALADKYNLEYRVFDLKDKEIIEENLKDIKVVLHAAGPFVHTAPPMVEACLATGTHYLDITGEYQIFEYCAALHEKALQSNIMILPGTGFDVVPSDCLASYLKKKLPGATTLSLAFAGMNSGFSRGTAKTMIENLGKGGKVRLNGKLKNVPNAYKTENIDFGKFTIPSATIPWGDLSTAFYSTGIPNIEVFMGMNDKMIKKLKLSNFLGWFFRLGIVKKYLKKQVNNKKEGPGKEQRAKGKSYFWGRVTDAMGNKKVARLSTAEGYTLTALTSVLIVQKVLKDELKTGFQTPSTAYGENLILEIPGYRFTDDQSD